jgi:ABC-type nickel/cobalt efflux system permease component RcnA
MLVTCDPIDFWLSVLQGSVGALFGLIGLFLVFWLTIRNERAKATRRAKTRKPNQIAGRIGTATAALARDVAWALVFGVTAITDSTAAVTRFVLEVGQDHPHVAACACPSRR